MKKNKQFITWAPDSWPKIGIVEKRKEKRDKFPRRFCEYFVEDYDKNGGCPEHPTAGSYLVVGYAYRYPNGEIRNISIGWICAGCLRRGWTRDGDKKIAIYPYHKPGRSYVREDQ